MLYCVKSSWWGHGLRVVVDRARRIRSEKLREHQYREKYARFLDRKRVEWDGENVEHMWEQVKVQEKCVTQSK